MRAEVFFRLMTDTRNYTETGAGGSRVRVRENNILIILERLAKCDDGKLTPLKTCSTVAQLNNEWRLTKSNETLQVSSSGLKRCNLKQIHLSTHQQ